MELSIRPLNDRDYEDLLVGWWRDWKWPAPDKDFLPSDGTGGIMVMHGDIPICAGFMYATNSKVAWVEWVISNRNYRDKENRAKAILLLVSTITDICKNSGFKYCYATLKSQSLIHIYEDLGYVSGGSDGVEMIKKI